MSEPYQPEPGEVRKCGEHWSHNFGCGGGFFVIGAARCVRCGYVARRADFPALAAVGKSVTP